MRFSNLLVVHMKSKYIKTKVIFTFLLLSLLIGCSAQQDTIKLGSILILTGDGNSWGIAERNGIDLAVEEINAAGGINSKLIAVNHQDDKLDPKTAITAFNTLTDIQGIDILIGPTWTPTALPLTELADQKKVLMISPSVGRKEFNEGSNYIFNLWPHDYLLADELAKMIYEEGQRNVAIIGAAEPWSQDLTQAFTKKFEQLGGKTFVQEPAMDQIDLRTEALKIKEKQEIDSVVLISGAMNVGLLAGKAIRDLGSTLPFYSVVVGDNMIQQAGKTYDGMIMLTSSTPNDVFVEKYNKRFGVPIDYGADTAYDAVMLLAQAMKETESENPTVLQEYLTGLKTYDGVSGTLTFDGKGGVTKPFLVKEIISGEQITVERSSLS